MAEVVPEKSRALKFAEQQLLRHGWEHGKGLGRQENGIAEAVQVKVKCDRGGVGHKEGEQFTFHWWDHVFNKASASLQVESDQNGVQLKKTVEEDEEDGMISNKKPRKAALAKAKLYGCFVKSATLLFGQEQPDPKPSSSDDSSSSDEEDDQKLDLSSTTKLSDADLMRACGGRTAHKGARYGLTMSAKLARLERQEAEFMAKYSKKSQPASAPPVCVAPTPPTSQSADQRAERQEETVKDSQRKKIQSTGSVIERDDNDDDDDDDEVSVSPETDVDPRKKKKKKVIEDIEVITDDVICVGNSEADHSHKTKRKHKKKNNNAEQNEEERTPAAESRSQEETVELHTEEVKKKKKKKKRKSSKTHSEPAEEEEGNNTEPSQSEPVQDCVPKPKKKRAAVLLEEAEVTEEVKQKRKKCKRDKSCVDNDSNEETLPPKKKKKKKNSKE